MTITTDINVNNLKHACLLALFSSPFIFCPLERTLSDVKFCLKSCLILSPRPIVIRLSEDCVESKRNELCYRVMTWKAETVLFIFHARNHSARDNLNSSVFRNTWQIYLIGETLVCHFYFPDICFSRGTKFSIVQNPTIFHNLTCDLGWFERKTSHVWTFGQLVQGWSRVDGKFWITELTEQ